MLRACMPRRVAVGGGLRRLSLWRSALRADYPAVLGLGTRRRTHCAHFVRCVRTTATSMFTKRAARAVPSPALLGATQRAATGPHPPRRTPWWHARATTAPAKAIGDARTTTATAKAGAGCARRACEAPRSTGLVAARVSALRQHARRGCSSAANEVSATSSATGPQARAPQGSRRAAPTASVARRAQPAPAFVAPTAEHPMEISTCPS